MYYKLSTLFLENNQDVTVFRFSFCFCTHFFGDENSKLIRDLSFKYRAYIQLMIKSSAYVQRCQFKFFQRGLAGVGIIGSWRWVWQVFLVLKKWRSLNGARQAEPAANLGKKDQTGINQKRPTVFAVVLCGFDPPFLPYISLSLSQRVLNDLYRARLPRGRMIWLLAHTLAPSPTVNSTSDKHKTGRERDTLITGEEGEGVGERGAKSYDRKKPGSL